jgi:hypothetical protein
LEGIDAAIGNVPILVSVPGLKKTSAIPRPKLAMGKTSQPNNMFFTKDRYEGILAHGHIIDYAQLT